LARVWGQQAAQQKAQQSTQNQEINVVVAAAKHDAPAEKERGSDQTINDLERQ
jgi:hypothetical protein